MPPFIVPDEIIEISDDDTAEGDLSTKHNSRQPTSSWQYDHQARSERSVSLSKYCSALAESADSDSASEYHNSSQDDISSSGEEVLEEFDESSDDDNEEGEESDEASAVEVTLNTVDEGFVRGTRSSSEKVHKKPLLEITREEFRSWIQQTENPDDLRLLYPPSLWKETGLDIVEDERKFLQGVRLTPSLDEEQWNEIDLTDFCVYNDFMHRSHPGKYESLHTVSSEQEHKIYLLDGVAEYENFRAVLHGATISRVSIGGLDLSSHGCAEQVWVQTRCSAKTDTWYKLKMPATGYEQIWIDFYWLANLAKYCIDYLNLAEAMHRRVALEDFREDFIDQMTHTHGNNHQFQDWESRTKHEGRDIRRHIVQFGSFVYDQYYNVTKSEYWTAHPLWDEIGVTVVRNDSQMATEVEKTLVTRNTAATFLPSFPQWGPAEYDLLEQEDCIKTVEDHRQKRLQCLRIHDKFKLDQSENFRIEDDVRVPKVEWTRQEAAYRNRSIGCEPEDLVNGLVLVRKEHKADRKFTFALVRTVTNDRRHVRVIWLTTPMETICGKAHYPIGNELFYSDKCNCFSVKISDIVGRYSISTTLESHEGAKTQFFVVAKYCEKEQCFVEPVATPDFLCRTPCLSPNTPGTKQSCESRPKSTENRLSQGPSRHHDRLANVSLFSGCGLFDRALETSGALSTVLSIDHDPIAIRSAKANCNRTRSKEHAEFVVSSVSTELRRIMKADRAFPDAGCVSAGCPCPGFSAINYRKKSKKSQRDCTLLAATMAWIEVLLPAYVVIENVVRMDSGSPNACCQAICFLVALGYQVRRVYLKAPEFGGCTLRKRLFILAAAPTLNLPQVPKPTHGNVSGLKATVSVREAISTLDPVHNDTLVTIAKPYHVPLVRLVSNVTNNRANFRDIIRRIPTSPPEQGIVDSKAFLTRSQKAWLNSLHNSKRNSKSRTMRRVHPEKFFRTVVTVASWGCCHTGQIIHYDQHRILSLEEVARAQGVPGSFVLVGTTAQKLRQVGNAVPWCFREAVGNVIKRAYQASNPMNVVMNIPRPAEYDVNLKDIKTDIQDDDNGSDIMLSTEAEFQLAQARRGNNVRLSGKEDVYDLTATPKSTESSDFALVSVGEHVGCREFSRASPRGSIEFRAEMTKSPTFGKRMRSSSTINEDSERAVQWKKAKKNAPDVMRSQANSFAEVSSGESESESDSENESDDTDEEEEENGSKEMRNSDSDDSESDGGGDDDDDDETSGSSDGTCSEDDLW